MRWMRFFDTIRPTPPYNLSIESNFLIFIFSSDGLRLFYAETVKHFPLTTFYDNSLMLLYCDWNIIFLIFSV